jgi:hypothetical protein
MLLDLKCIGNATKQCPCPMHNNAHFDATYVLAPLIYALYSTKYFSFLHRSIGAAADISIKSVDEEVSLFTESR